MKKLVLLIALLLPVSAYAGGWKLLTITNKGHVSINELRTKKECDKMKDKVSYWINGGNCIARMKADPTHGCWLNYPEEYIERAECTQ